MSIPKFQCPKIQHPILRIQYRVSKKKVNEFGEEYLNNEPSELAQIWNLDSGDPVHQNDHGSFFHSKFDHWSLPNRFDIAEKSLRPKDFSLQVLDVGSLTNGQLMVIFNEKMTHGHFDVPDPPSPNSKFELILTVRC